MNNRIAIVRRDLHSSVDPVAKHTITNLRWIGLMIDHQRIQIRSIRGWSLLWYLLKSAFPRYISQSYDGNLSWVNSYMIALTHDHP